MEKLEPLCSIGGNVKWYSYCRKTLWLFLKNLKTELPNDLSIPLPGIQLEEFKAGFQRDNCIPMSCSIMHGSLSVEATQVSKDRCMGKENV